MQRSIGSCSYVAFNQHITSRIVLIHVAAKTHLSKEGFPKTDTALSATSRTTSRGLQRYRYPHNTISLKLASPVIGDVGSALVRSPVSRVRALASSSPHGIYACKRRQEDTSRRNSTIDHALLLTVLSDALHLSLFAEGAVQVCSLIRLTSAHLRNPRNLYPDVPFFLCLHIAYR